MMEIEERILVFVRYNNSLTGEEKTRVAGLSRQDYEYQRQMLIDKTCLYVKEIQIIKPKFIPAY